MGRMGKYQMAHWFDTSTRLSAGKAHHRPESSPYLPECGRRPPGADLYPHLQSNSLQTIHLIASGSSPSRSRCERKLVASFRESPSSKTPCLSVSVVNLRLRFAIPVASRPPGVGAPRVKQAFTSCRVNRQGGPERRKEFSRKVAKGAKVQIREEGF